MTLTDQLVLAQKSLESTCSVVLQVWNPGGAGPLAEHLTLSPEARQICSYNTDNLKIGEIQRGLRLCESLQGRGRSGDPDVWGECGKLGANYSSDSYFGIHQYPFSNK